jgi:acyl-CoA thioester hydrolase
VRGPTPRTPGAAPGGVRTRLGPRGCGRWHDPRPVSTPDSTPSGPAADEGRDAFPHALAIPTRWKDNDVYGHVNNVDYYAYFDTVINQYLIAEGGLDIHRGAVIGLCAESHCRYHAALAFPETVEARLRVGRLGRSSVRYEIGLFRDGEAAPAATGWFVHVFVDREGRRSADIPGPLRAALERLRHLA